MGTTVASPHTFAIRLVKIVPMFVLIIQLGTTKELVIIDDDVDNLNNNITSLT